MIHTQKTQAASTHRKPGSSQGLPQSYNSPSMSRNTSPAHLKHTDQQRKHHQHSSIVAIPFFAIWSWVGQTLQLLLPYKGGLPNGQQAQQQQLPKGPRANKKQTWNQTRPQDRAAVKRNAESWSARCSCPRVLTSRVLAGKQWRSKPTRETGPVSHHSRHHCLCWRTPGNAYAAALAPATVRTAASERCAGASAV